MVYLKNTTDLQKLYIPKSTSNIPYSDYYYTKQESDERFASKDEVEDLSDNVSALEAKVDDEKTYFFRYEQDDTVSSAMSKEDFAALCKKISVDDKPVNIIFTDSYKHYPQYFYAEYSEEITDCSIYALCREDDNSSEYDTKIYIRCYWDEEQEMVQVESSTLSYDIVTAENVGDYAITPDSFNTEVSKFGIPFLNVTSPNVATGSGAMIVAEGFDWVNTQMKNNVVPLFVLKFPGDALYYWVKSISGVSKTANVGINWVEYVFTDSEDKKEITIIHNVSQTNNANITKVEVRPLNYILRFSYPYNSSESAKTGYDYTVPKWNSILKSTVIFQAEDSSSEQRKLYTATGLYRASAIADNRIYFTLEDGTKTVMTFKLGAGDNAQILSWLPITDEQNEA